MNYFADLPDDGIPERLWRLDYAIPGDRHVTGVVRARSHREAIDKVNADEVALGRGPIVPGSVDCEPASDYLTD